MIRTLLIENDPLLLSALTSSLELQGVTIVAACTGAEQAMQAAETEDFEAVLTDLDLGDGPNGIVIAHALRRRRPHLGVVVLTSYSDPRLVGSKLAQLPLGAEYVLKHEVNAVSALREHLERAISRAAEPAAEPIAPVPASVLTDSQIDTMRLVAQGMTNAEIARARFVSEGSVERTINRIGNQLGITGDRTRNSRVQITRAYYALSGADGHDPIAS